MSCKYFLPVYDICFFISLTLSFKERKFSIWRSPIYHFFLFMFWAFYFMSMKYFPNTKSQIFLLFSHLVSYAVLKFWILHLVPFFISHSFFIYSTKYRLRVSVLIYYIFNISSIHFLFFSYSFLYGIH